MAYAMHWNYIMTLEEILEEWGKDSHINHNSLSDESLRIPKLHHKYYSMLVQERLRLAKMRASFDERIDLLEQWLDGQLDSETLKQHNLEVQRKMLTKVEREKKLNLLPEVVQGKLKNALQQEKVDALESIIKTFQNRGYIIRTALDWQRLQMGG